MNRAQRRAASVSPTGLERSALRRAQRPRPVAVTPALRKANGERQAYLGEREGKERRSMLRGLILLAVLVLVFSLVRAGTERVFYAGWWRQW